MIPDFPDTPMNDFNMSPKSTVKLIKNTKGLNWEIKLVVGEEHLIKGLKDKVLEIHNELEKETKLLSR